MLISIIVAIGRENQIGLNNKLLWKLKDDLQNFKKITTGHCVLFGRKTFESIGRPLPNRTNIVITRNKNFTCDGLNIFDDVDNAVKFAEKQGENELFICGGAEIYKYFLKNKLIDKIYLTSVDYKGDADVFFPKINLNDWEIKEEKNFLHNENNEFDFKFEILCKK